MSGVYIRGMEMPTSCFQCQFRTKIDPDNLMCCISQRVFEDRFYHIEHRDQSCPLVPVPPHGRLIDADALLESEQGYTIPNYNSDGYVADLEGAYTEVQIENAPTIIPADKEGK